MLNGEVYAPNKEQIAEMINFCTKYKNADLMNIVLNIYFSSGNRIEDFTSLSTLRKNATDVPVIVEMLSENALQMRAKKHELSDTLKDKLSTVAPRDIPHLDKEPYSDLNTNELLFYGNRTKGSLLSLAFSNNEHTAVNIINQLLNKGADINAIYPPGKTLLMMAAENNFVFLTSFLLNKGAAVDLASYNQTPLMIASEKGYEKIVRILLTNGAEESIQNDSKKTALDLAQDTKIRDLLNPSVSLEKAVKAGRFSIVKRLLESSPTQSQKDEALLASITHMYSDLAKLLINKNANVNAMDSIENISALSKAIDHEKWDIAKELILHDADFNLPESIPALVRATVSNAEDLVEMMLSKNQTFKFDHHAFVRAFKTSSHSFDEIFSTMVGIGVKTNNLKFTQGMINTYFMMGKNLEDISSLLTKVRIEAENKPVFKEMLSDKFLAGIYKKHQLVDDLKMTLLSEQPFPSLNQMPFSELSVEDISAYGRIQDPLLSIAFTKGPIVARTVTDGLLDKGANINALIQNFDTLLIMALENKYFDLAENLISLGANVNYPQENPPLFVALKHAVPIRIINLMLEKGADINATRNGYSPLMQFAIDGNNEMITLLLKLGANKNNMTYEGKTAYDLANKQLDPELLKQLKPESVEEVNSNLRRAARTGNLTEVRKLLQMKDSIQIDAETWGHTALCFAAENGHLDIVKLLIEKNADINKRSNGETPLMLAIRENHMDVAKELISKGADVNPTESFTGMSALMWAATYGDVDIVKQLLDKGAKYNHIHQKSGQTALMMAAKGGHKKVVELLLSQNDINVTKSDNDQETALDKASNFPEIAEMISSRAKILGSLTPAISPLEITEDKSPSLTNDPSSLEKRKSLRFTTSSFITEDKQGEKEIIINVASRTNLNLELDRELLKAVRKGDPGVVDTLLTQGASSNAANVLDTTALMFAAQIGSRDITSMLLKAGADPNVQDQTKDNALIIAVREGFTDVALELIKGGARADPPKEDFKGMTPLMWAATRGDSNMVRELLLNGADVNFVHYKSGQNALIMAANGGHIDVIKILLEGGEKVDITTVDKEGHSALTIVQNNPSALELLENHKEKFQVNQTLSGLNIKVKT